MVIDCKKIAGILKQNIIPDILKLKSSGVMPTLAVVWVGKDESSKIYIDKKRLLCAELSVGFIEINFPKNTTQKEILNQINILNNDKKIHGILVQLPLPSHIDEDEIALAISPAKDVDALHPINFGLLSRNFASLAPCTALGVMEIFKKININLNSKHAVIIGRSDIVGKPLAHMLLNENATVTICHSKTLNLGEITTTADILISAVGKINLVTKDMIKPGAIVVDIGINRDEKGKIKGDVDFENVKNIASFITPVPRGVGALTCIMLIKNLVICSAYTA